MLTTELPARGQYQTEVSRGIFITHYAVGPIAEAFLAKCQAQGFLCVPVQSSRHRDHFRAAYFRLCDRQRLPYVEVELFPGGGGRIHYDIPPSGAVIDPEPLREELSACYAQHPELTHPPRRGYWPEQFRPASVSEAIAYVPLPVDDDTPLRIILRHLKQMRPTGGEEGRGR